jgi:hypothetical protein
MPTREEILRRVAEVLYHCRNPLEAFEKVASVTRRMVVVETAWFRTVSRLPLLRYAEGSTLNDDETNRFVFNTPALRAMLADCGFRRTEVVWKSPLSPLRILQSLCVNRASFLRAGWNSNLAGYGRIVVKGYK